MANYRAAARRSARRYGLDPTVFVRQIQQESGFNPNARSPVGARGIAQIMPATARGWGVNPDDPIASLDAAAKNMASYVKRYGGYENALRAYNAGPGRIQASHGFAETNNYVRTILGGRRPSTKTVRPGGGGASVSPVSLKTTVNPLAQAVQALALQRQPQQVTPPAPPAFSAGPALPEGYVPVQSAGSERKPGVEDALRAVAAMAPGATAKVVGGKVTLTGGKGGKAPRGERGHYNVRELYWRGPGGINLKNNQKVPQNFVDGHEDHVHVAAGPKGVVSLGKIARQMGLHVGENPHFGGVAPVHVTNSNHYNGTAIDVSGDVGQMRKFAHLVASLRL